MDTADLLIDLPAAPDAEAALLGIVIENPRTFGGRMLEDGFTQDFFHDKAMAELFLLIADRLRKQKAVDPSSLREDIRAEKPRHLKLSKLVEVLNQERDETAWQGYVSAVRQTHAKRLLILASRQVEDMSGHDAVSAVKRASDAALGALNGVAEIKTAKEAVKQFLREMLERQQQDGTPGVSTGIDCLDNHTGGLRRGELWVVGGKTSHGKSILMLQMATKAILEGKRVLVFTLELGADEIVARLISNICTVPMEYIMSPSKIPKQKVEAITHQIKEGANQIMASQLQICDVPDMNMDQVAGHALRAKEIGGLDLVVLDYLQMVKVPHVKGQNREQEVASISRSCKQMAKRLGCPVLTATQLNDDGQSRESRAIEHDADTVLLIEDDGDHQAVRFWKCRNGERGTEYGCERKGQYQRFNFFS